MTLLNLYGLISFVTLLLLWARGDLSFAQHREADYQRIAELEYELGFTDERPRTTKARW